MRKPDIEDTTRLPLERKDLIDVEYEDPLAFFVGLRNALYVMAAFLSGGWLLYRLLREVL